MSSTSLSQRNVSICSFCYYELLRIKSHIGYYELLRIKSHVSEIFVLLVALAEHIVGVQFGRRTFKEIVV